MNEKRQPTIVQISNVLFFKMTLMEHTKKEGRIDSMKKMISILLSVALFLSVFPVSIFAAGSTNENTESGYTYTVENGEATITGCDDSITGDVVLPDTLGGYPVTQIGREAFRYNRYLTSIRIPDSVTSIGESAFFDSSLTSIEIPDSVTNIATSVFYGCNKLEKIFYKSDIASWCNIQFEDMTSNPLYNHGTLYINDEAVCNLVIPNTVKNIGDHAFVGFRGLTNVKILEGVTSIGDGSFEDCNSLTSIEIPDSVTSIGNGAFDNCSSLTSITIPDSITIIEDFVFYGCSNLTSIEISDSVTSIGDRAFWGCTGLTNIEIPNGVTHIGNYAFWGCTNLINIEIPNSVTNIGDAVFRECASLTSIKIPDNVTSIGTSMFLGCTDLTSIIIPDGVKSIGVYAFADCTSLTNIVIPDSLTSIGNGAFEDCNSLTSIEIPDSVTKIGDYAFQGCTGLTNIEIPNGVTHIGNNVFWQCTGLSSMKIPDSVTSIGDSAFQDCSGLTKIEIPDSVTSIGDYAFRNCTGLTSIKIPNSVTSIGNDAFPSKITILCTNNSAAYTYALQHHITYELFPYIYLSTNTFHVGDEYQLTVAIDSAVDVCWYSSNPDVASISSSGNMTALSEGETLITAVISGYTEEDYVATCLISIKPVYHVYYISAGEVHLPATQRKLSEKVLALSSYTPVRTGYRFEGWSTEPNDTTVEYQPGDTYTEDADLTLYAVWKWTPKCSACDGTGQKRVSCQECDGDGYTTVKTSRTCTICSGKGTVKQTYTVKEEHTCSICHGELVTWSDSLQGWVPCRGCNGLGTVTVEVEKEKNVTCSTCNGLGKIYSTSTKTCSTCLGVGYKKVRCTQCGGDGICTQDSFGVSYDPNGGTGAPASQTKEKASSLTLSKDIPVKDGYIFCGWSTSVGGSVKYQPGDIYSADQDLILVAVWQKEPEPIPGYSCGDIDNNGTINLKDVTQLQKYLAGWDVEVATEYCDVNADGKINLKDVTHLQKYLAGWEVKLGQS